MSIFKRALLASVSGAALAVAIEFQVREWMRERDRRLLAEGVPEAKDAIVIGTRSAR